MAGAAPIPLEEAQARLLDLAGELSLENVDMDGALGRYLARPLQARRTQPASDMSAMDGYAVVEGDLAGPWQVVGESAAGHPFTGTFAQGQAIRISTGALLPGDAHAVIVQEDTDRAGDMLRLTGDGPMPPRKHIRRCGTDFAEGQEVLAAGTRIGPAQVALGLSAGHKHLPVFRRPRICVIDSGDELAASPDDCALHQIPASNGAMLAAMARSVPVDVQRTGPVRDSLGAIIDALEVAAEADIIVTSGGASVGDHDLIRPALETWGATIDFWRVAIKPGKPLLVATRERSGGRQVIIGLPGNPVSSFVTAYHFMLPLLRRMLGAARPIARPVTAALGEALRETGPRREFVRGYWDGELVRVQAVQDSGALASLAASNILIDRPANAPAARPGDLVPVFLIENGGIT